MSDELMVTCNTQKKLAQLSTTAQRRTESQKKKQYHVSNIKQKVRCSVHLRIPGLTLLCPNHQKAVHIGRPSNTCVSVPRGLDITTQANARVRSSQSRTKRAKSFEFIPARVCENKKMSHKVESLATNKTTGGHHPENWHQAVFF